MKETFLPWEWQPIEFIPDGCNRVSVRDNEANVTEMCSCDYWWLPKEKKKLYTTFRLE
jgi:hypothetical protein